MRSIGMLFKELKQWCKEIKVNILIYLIAPVIIGTVYGIIYKNIVDPDRNITKFTVGYVDFDNSTMSKPLINIFNNSKLKKIIEIKKAPSVEKLKNGLTNGKYSSAIIIPDNLSSNTFKGEGAKIQVLKASYSGIDGDITLSIVKSYAESLNVNSGVYRALYKNINDNSLLQKIYNKSLPEIMKIFNKNYITFSDVQRTKKTDSKQEFAVNMLIMFSFFIALKQASGAMKEKEEGTFQRIQSATGSVFSFYSGKILATSIISFIQICSFIIVTSLITGVKWGNITLLGFTAIIHSIVIAAIAAILMIVFKTSKLMTVVTMMLIMFMSILSGTFYPSQYMFGFGKTLSDLTINHILQSCYKNIMVGNSFGSISSNFGVLSLISVVLILAASAKLKFLE